ncbi:MAG TPA: 23S rRNA (guanosine(2251)-2'-O)-methyltransferase RlmB [Candidatus Solibacter sp.]|jgi:23S rRNA (guanosine2251-2'-O)-methyltransferase|nr:23S rRNA (guanosine(2251)-2'-O)-methyltransferase RlmB [Candidatus Solibacter sp.]
MKSKRQPAALVYGKNPVLEALRAGRDVKRLVVLASAQPEPRLQEILELASRRSIEVDQVDRQRLNDISHSDSHQGVVAYVGRRRYLELPELLGELASEPAPMLLALDGIQDPQNLGSICRSAEAAGVAGIVIPRHRSAEITPAVAKASAGAVEHLRVAMVSSLAQTLERLKQDGYWTVGLAGEAEMDYGDAKYDGRVALVVGSEGEGLHRLVRDRCDQLVSLPMLGRVGSLNAAVAASIVLYEALRQRRRSSP